LMKQSLHITISVKFLGSFKDNLFSIFQISFP
jgi:hypothetical protein